MLEETIIRESANNKLQQRMATTTPAKVIGPPVTFTNPANANSSAGENAGTEESKTDQPGAEGLNENSFDVVQSPLRRNNSVYVGAGPKDKSKGASTAMVP